MMKFSKKYMVIFAELLAFLLPFAVMGNEDSMVEKENYMTIVERFYQAIKEHRCEEAVQLRPGYTKKQCQEITDISNFNASPANISLDRRGGLIVIELNVIIYKAKRQENWHGFMTVIQRGNHWKIINDSYLSFKEIGGLSAYLASPRYQAIYQPSTFKDIVPKPTPVTSEPTASGPSRATKDFMPLRSIAAPTTPHPSQRLGPHHVATPRPGATTILDACWSPEELRSLPGEETIRAFPTDFSPPKRVNPRRPNAPLGSEFARSVRSVNPVHGEKLVALTFDLCEQANEITGYDGKIVDILRAEKVNATFYAGGKWMRSHPERAMQLIADPLFEIGNHTWTHGNMRVLRGKEMEEQIQWTQAQYELLRDQLLNLPCAALVNHDIRPLPSTFRFPYGTCDATALRAVTQAGLYPIQWNVVSGDPARKQTADLMVKEILDKVRPGSIVIAHANGRGWHTSEALKTLIPALREHGYHFVTISRLLESGNPVAVDFCYEKHPGDNLKYDKLFGRGTE